MGNRWSEFLKLVCLRDRILCLESIFKFFKVRICLLGVYWCFMFRFGLGIMLKLCYSSGVLEYFLVGIWLERGSSLV